MEKIKSVFITGGTTGLGFGLAKAYLDQGWRVGVCGRSEQKFRENFKGHHERLFFYCCDVSDFQALKKSIDEFVGVPHQLDMIIANAGVSLNQKLDWPDFKDLRRVSKINIDGVLNTLEASLHYLKNKTGSQVVFVSSLAAFTGLPGAGMYGATKAAVLRLGEGMAIDFKKYGISVTTLCPGFVDTPLTKRNPHAMPFLMSLDKAVERMMKAIKKKKVVYAFPKRTYFIVRLLNLLPSGIYAKLMRVKLFNYAKTKGKQ